MGLSFPLRTGQSLHPASTPASRPEPGASLPGTLASPRTGLSPAGCRELGARLRHDLSLPVIAPGLLDARGSRLRACLTWMTAERGGVTPTRGGTDRPDTGVRWTVGDRRATHPAAVPATAGRGHPPPR